ncbi:hypothetical protein PM3016_2936 [Paenibacillus mucilaginosus 3016]|uniref:DUF2627 domain-containing protein n=3 Tax=Paenibacillus mucilaginosus TaxID=61624 RepID=H6NME0_9BACL|nr:DUF2627 domain-containing protein [Paenibacillus mucilaginosus]AFC29806.1 hypothetical protein PM3016_2936 [Paenibacillus mucilaginosus 3016]WDM31248.1 DUF2627 domain-containing protein [Paenibacillus mucilaginosus]
MKAAFYRFIAILMLVIPGLMATYGFLAVKDAWFAQFDLTAADPGIQWGKLLLGLLLFGAGVAFIGGWIFFRDRKRNYVAPRFRAKKRKKG